MLIELRVKNFAIVEDGVLNLGEGMTAFTGETGAGKSLLLDAVTLLLGAKARSDLVRSGSKSAEVEGVFDLSRDASKIALASQLGFEIEADEGSLLVVRREISSSDTAKNRVWIQGKSATRQQLQDLLRDWVEVSGQHEFLRLSKDDYNLSLIDQFGSLKGDVSDYQKVFEELRLAEGELEAQTMSEQERLARTEYLRFQVEELEKAGIHDDAAGEEEGLVQLRVRLGSLEKIRAALATARARLDGGESDDLGVVSGLSQAGREIRSLANIGDEFRTLGDEFEKAQTQISELSYSINKLLGALDADPDALENAESRISNWNRLKRKYAADTAGLAQLLKSAKAEFARLEGGESHLATLRTKIEKLRKSAFSRAEKLSDRRKKSASELQKLWKRELGFLGMKSAEIIVGLETSDDLSTSGMDRAQVLFSGNPGESPKPLGKVASGGELSRIMLSVKHLIAGRSEIGVYLFDEVDAGIGGETAQVVGNRLRKLAGDNQVIVVTHLAQVAASAHTQFHIFKSTDKGRTRTVIEELGDKQRPQEIARMLGGLSITEETRSHAKALIQESCESFAHIS